MNQQNLPIPAASTAAPALPRDAFKKGQAVGGSRWAYDHAHSDCWLAPWRGVVLAIDDPRAWVNSMVKAKVYGKPTRAEIRAHITHLEQLWRDCPPAKGSPPIFASTVIVLWDFGDEKKIMHESAESLRPFAADVAAWEAARAEKRAEEAARAAAWQATQTARLAA